MTIEKALFQSPPVLRLLPEHLDAYQALEKGQFVPFFQPIVTLRTGQVKGFEVLARWQHPLEGLIPPDTFIPVAEQGGWIGELTQQILQKAFAAAAALPAPLTLAVNISPLQLRDASLPEQIWGLASEAKFPLSRLVIEITESALIDNLRSAGSIGAELKKLGCRLALDDFGTGYSSLSHLQALPFDKLKVDRSFINSMTEKRESRKIVAAVIGLGQSLGLTTVAEGIETQEQAEMVLWLGCDFGQGDFYGRPIPAEELPACISAPRSKLFVKSGTAWKKVSAANLELSSTQRLAQLQSIYDGAPVGLAFLDQKLRYVSLNQRLADMNGASVEDHLGNPVAEMIPELFPYVEPYIRRALSGEALSDVETQIPKTDKALLLSYQPARDEGGEVIGVSVAINDITERKRAERALMQSEAHYRSMVDLNPQVLWIMDPQGRNLDVSPRWDKTTGLMKSQSTDHEWLRAVHPDDIQPTVRSIAESRRDGSGIDVQYRVADGLGHWIWKRSRGAPRFDAVGSIVCWYGSVDDIDGPTPFPKTLSRVKTSNDVKTMDHVASLSFVLGNQRKRVEVLEALEILDTPPEADFDDLVSLAAEICGTPISLISLIDTERQWFKAAKGLTASETPITVSFCAHAIEHVGMFVVGDATKDERFKENPLVTGNPHIRFYAGLPLYAGEGVAIGTLCVIDTVPRTLSPQQAKSLTILSRQVQAQIDLRSERRKRAIETKENDSSALASNQKPSDDVDYGSKLAGIAPTLKEDDSMRTLDLGNFGLWLGGGADDGMARHILKGLSNGVTIGDATLPGAPLIYVNPAFERMTGYAGEDVVGLSCNFLQGTDKDQPGVHQIRSAIREAREERVTLRNYRKDGTQFWNELYLSPIFDASGVLSHFVGVQNDVTAEIEAKLQLSEERDRLHAASECSMDCLYICEAIRNEGGELVDFIFNFVNSNGAEAVSLPTSELMGARMSEVLPANRELGLFDLYKHVVLTGKPLVHELAKVDQVGCSSWMRVQAVKLRDGVVITLSDITLRKREEERTVFRAEHDPLTALPNRSVLRDRVESGLSWAKRHEGMLAVFLIDLDGFKAINDSLGHAAGDEALIIVASRLTKCMREVDSVIRVGGDEFIIVMPELRRQSDAEVLAARILDVLRTPMHIEDQDVCVTSSIGVALFPQSARTTKELLARADGAMYLAKRGGKNKYEIYSLETVETPSEVSFVIT